MTTQQERWDAYLSSPEGQAEAAAEDAFTAEADRIGGWHPEACWYTMKATRAEQLEHLRTHQPPCEYSEKETP